MSNADDKPKLSRFFKICQNLHFDCHIWIQHDKCIQMSTNKPSIGSVILEISPEDFEKISKFNFYITAMWKRIKEYLFRR